MTEYDSPYYHHQDEEWKPWTYQSDCGCARCLAWEDADDTYYDWWDDPFYDDNELFVEGLE